MNILRNTASALLAAMAILGSMPTLADSTTERLDALQKRLERLEDANEVEIVQRTYGYFVDKAMWAEVADLFAESGTYEIGGRGVFIGPKRVLEYLRVGLGTERPVEGRLINHMQFQPIVTVSEDGRTAQLRMKALVMSSGGWGDVIYENRYVKENGIWKIASIRAPFVMYSSNDGWAKVTTPNTRPESFLPPPDRMPTEIYLTYPSQYIVPFHYPHPVTGKPYEGARTDQAAERIQAQ